MQLVRHRRENWSGIGTDVKCVEFNARFLQRVSVDTLFCSRTIATSSKYHVEDSSNRIYAHRARDISLSRMTVRFAERISDLISSGEICDSSPTVNFVHDLAISSTRDSQTKAHFRSPANRTRTSAAISIVKPTPRLREFNGKAVSLSLFQLLGKN